MTKKVLMQKTIPDVFIIETLDPDDEGNGRFEGSVISHVLRLHKKKPIYSYVRTREAFEEAVNEFRKSRYRYLHISAHGNPTGMFTTNNDHIPYNDLAKILAPALKNRRMFLSTCSMVHKKMAAEIIPKTQCYSIVGPIEDIDFSCAAVMWPAMYHLLFEFNNKTIKLKELTKTLKGVSELFKVKIGFYNKTSNGSGYRKISL